jgi:hypothetical protein
MEDLAPIESLTPDLEALIATGEMTREEARAVAGMEGAGAGAAGAGGGVREEAAAADSANLGLAPIESLTPDLEALIATGEMTREEARAVAGMGGAGAGAAGAGAPAAEEKAYAPSDYSTPDDGGFKPPKEEGGSMDFMSE